MMRDLGDLWSERIAPALETALFFSLAGLGVHHSGIAARRRVRTWANSVCGTDSGRGALFAAMSDPAVVLGPAREVADANPQAAEILGTGETQHKSACPQLFEALRRGDSTVTIPVRGSERVYDIERSPVSGDCWEMGTELVVLRDVTARAGRQRELERETERLESLASGIAHDLRNPLGLGRVHLGLAQEEYDGTHLDETAWALDRIDELVDELRAGTREGEQATDMVAVEVEELTAAAWRTVDTDEATLVTATDRTICADRQRMQRLFENLFRNAVEHCGSAVTVTVGPLPNGLYVEDDGPGVPAEMRGDVFDAGYSTKADGGGFGLHIVDRIATAHGWTLHLVESEEGGARFEIRGIDAQTGIQTHSPA